MSFNDSFQHRIILLKNKNDNYEYVLPWVTVV